MADKSEKPAFHSWRYGPGGEASIFTDEDIIPEGWEDHPGKVQGLDAMTALRAQYAEKMGKKPFMGWDEATLREKMAE